METRYEWDPAKAERNERVHGISFETAIEIFGDPNLIVRENVETDEEQRLDAIGMTRGLTLLLVVFVDRSEAGVEVIRVISARKGERYERTIYEKQLR
jgi:uncharacterized DUF497 family protein